jgi:Tfp pilus assembly protein PilO
MKKKLANLDIRIQFAAIAFLLLVFAYGAYTLAVAPQGVKAAKLQKDADAVQLQIYQRRSEIKKGLNPPTIETADLFRLARAMPDRTDMPGIILTLSDLARSAGIKFDLIEPVNGGATLNGSYETNRIHLLFNGDFYGLSDFLYRLRSLVSVHDGKLEASGRLLNTDTVTFNVITNMFPKISAELFVNAYVYGATAPPAAAAPTTTNADGTTTTTPATTDTTTPPAGATAAGATP